MPLKNALSIREIRETGFNVGWNTASWVDMPEIGQTLSRELDWEGIGEIETRQDAINAWECIILDNVQNDQSAERAGLAYGINQRNEEIGEFAAESGWDEFDSAVIRGIRAYRVKHYPLRRKRK
jgi:hypothetical protein